MSNRIILLGDFFEYIKALRNLGDQLQHYAMVKWLNRHYPDFEIKDVFYFTAIDELEKVIEADDIIVFQSSGAMGDEGLVFEKWRLDVCEAFSSNRIIVFPQTVFFRKEENMLKSKRVYEKHTNLTIMARDYVSLSLARQFFPRCHLLVMPDFVLSLKGEFNVSARKDKEKPLLIFRHDFQTNEKGQKLVRGLLKDFDSYDLAFPDTKHSRDLERRDFVEKVMSHISSYDFVVTDRMHGMILCAILAVPCICLAAKPEIKFHKNKATYQSWLSQIPYIKFCENDENELKEALGNISDCERNPGLAFERYIPYASSKENSPCYDGEPGRAENETRNFDYLFNYFLPHALRNLRNIRKVNLFPDQTRQKA